MSIVPEDADPHLSQHPVDELIRRLIRTADDATAEELRSIVDRIATAPFDPRLRPVPFQWRGQVVQGRALGQWDDALTVHWLQHVLIEQQWLPETTPDEYLASLRRGVRSPHAAVALYRRRGGHVAITATPTVAILRSRRHGEGRLQQLLVVYSADRGIVITGYQFSHLEAIGIPGNAQWLNR